MMMTILFLFPCQPRVDSVFVLFNYTHSLNKSANSTKLGQLLLYDLLRSRCSFALRINPPCVIIATLLF